MDRELLSFIEILEREIKEQAWGLTNYIGQKDWNKANNQQWYIAGLERALQIANSTRGSEVK